MRRTKQKIPEIMAIKNWLSLPEACAFMDMSINIFQDFAIKNGITISAIGNKKYYRKDQLEAAIEKNIIMN